jgi:hypothetical protein
MDGIQNKTYEEKLELIIQLLERLFSDTDLDKNYEGSIEWIKLKFQFTDNLNDFQELLTFLEDIDLVKIIYRSLKFKYSHIIENEKARQEIEDYRFLREVKKNMHDHTETVTCAACDNFPCVCSDPQHNS